MSGSRLILACAATPARAESALAWKARYSDKVLGGFAVSVLIGLVLGFLFGVGCAAAVLYTIFLTGYRAALRDSAAGGNTDRYREQMRLLDRR